MEFWWDFFVRKARLEKEIAEWEALRSAGNEGSGHLSAVRAFIRTSAFLDADLKQALSRDA